LAELDALIPKVQAGDILLMTYSGHTGQDAAVGLPKIPMEMNPLSAAPRSPPTMKSWETRMGRLLA